MNVVILVQLSTIRDNQREKIKVIKFPDSVQEIHQVYFGYF